MRRKEGANKGLPLLATCDDLAKPGNFETIRPGDLYHFETRKGETEYNCGAPDVLYCTTVPQNGLRSEVIGGSFRWAVGKTDRRPGQVDDSEGHRVPWGGGIPKG